jgi:glucose-1-phosphate cytidylyltransferase
MGEATQRIPKPMIPVGTQPILWHIMKWYASWGHTEFILCLGYRQEIVKEYFLNYREAIANDFVLSGNGVQLLGSDMDDWQITFLDTGIEATIGNRLLATAPFVGDEEFFLATYGDGLTDVPLDDMIETLRASDKTGIFLSVRPRLSYHVVEADDDGVVRSISAMDSADVRINGGFFVFRRRVLDALRSNEDVMDAAARLAEQEELLAYRFDGFWAPMDTIKDKQDLDALVAGGHMPWRGRSRASTG